ncbi:hypothetical protein [Diaphorobacter ruginosibacter]|uniref:hypothetical protein n=1 Tax=Diaphorobacter ruginosibacter TaxID=1715720 RepID=UPI00333E63E8
MTAQWQCLHCKQEISNAHTGGCCDDCFLVVIGKGDIAICQIALNRKLILKNPDHVALQQKHEKFMAAAKALLDHREKHPKDYRHRPEGAALFLEFLNHAPPEVLKEFHDKAVECDFMPETKFVNDAGEPVYSAEQIAEKFGVPVEQVEKDLSRLFGEQLENSNVHRVQ